jgi:hypothetical protein
MARASVRPRAWRGDADAPVDEQQAEIDGIAGHEDEVRPGPQDEAIDAENVG